MAQVLHQAGEVIFDYNAAVRSIETCRAFQHTIPGTIAFIAGTSLVLVQAYGSIIAVTFWVYQSLLVLCGVFFLGETYW